MTSNQDHKNSSFDLGFTTVIKNDDNALVSNTYDPSISITCTYRGNTSTAEGQVLPKGPKGITKVLPKGTKVAEGSNSKSLRDDLGGTQRILEEPNGVSMENPIMNNHLNKHQRELESLMSNLGVQRELKSEEASVALGDPLANRGHLQITKGALALVAKGLNQYIDENDNKGKGRNPSWIKPLRDLGMDHGAYIGLLGCFSSLASDDDFGQCASLIGRMVEDELWSRALKAEDKESHKRLKVKLKKQAGGLKRRPGVTKAGRKSASKRVPKEAKAIEWKDWSTNQTRQVGMAILNAVLKHSGVFTLAHKLGSEVPHLTLTEEAQGFLTDARADSSWIRPIFLPMVVPPKPWDAVDTGCYLTKEISRKVQLVRTHDPEHRSLVEAHVKGGRAKEFLDGINRIQATPYRINRRVLEMVKWAFDNEIILDSFPKKNLLELPEYPENFDDLEWQDQRIHKTLRAETHEMNRGILSEQAGFRTDLWVADTMTNYDRFYLPHNADFRGRVYPIPHFNHQRSDHIKALFEFADGVALGEDGGYWLAIHLANCGDFERVSKKGLGDRIDWVIANRERILSVAKDPTKDLWWTEADSPFCFLAACFDWAGYEASGEAHVSHLPVALDGSNSGIQHYSAALRSSRDAQHVNLVPLDQPADMYQVVADKVAQQVAEDAAKGDEMAKLWEAFGVTRSVVKRPTMTFAYSAETFGFKQQIMEDLMKPLRRRVLLKELDEHPFGEFRDQSAAAGYLAKAIYEATVNTVQDAAQGMKFLQSCAGALAHEGKAMNWTNPVGFPVVHKYIEWEIARVELFLYNRAISATEAAEWDHITEEGDVFKRVQTNMRVKPTTVIKKTKQRSAVAPNVIHSLDSAHLIHTVNQAWDKGIRDFCLIHDSFATHAGRTDEFFDIIREAFVDMYEKNDLFQTIYETTMAQVSEKGRKKLSALPDKGELDLESVKQALYAFA